MDNSVFQKKTYIPEIEITQLCEQVSTLGKDYTDAEFYLAIARFYLMRLLKNEEVMDYILEHDRRFFKEILDRRVIEIHPRYLGQGQ